MQITLEQLHKSQMTPGWVLIEFYANKEIRLENGTTIAFPDSWKQHENTPTFGRVIKVSETAVAEEWETENELQEGDEVFFDYKALMFAQLPNTDRLVFISDANVMLVLIRYEQCYAYFRNGVVHPINGCIFVHDVPMEQEGEPLLLPQRYSIDPFRARIVKIGKSIKYRHEKYKSTPDGVLQPGMVVTVKPYRSQYLQHPMFGSNLPIKRLQDRDILSIDTTRK